MIVRKWYSETLKVFRVVAGDVFNKKWNLHKRNVCLLLYIFFIHLPLSLRRIRFTV